MFCNGPRTDEGDIARLELTTIAGMMSLKVLFVLDHDCGQYRWFGWADNIGGLVGPISCPLIPGVVQTFRRSQEYEEVCLFSHKCTYLVGCD